jgi:hypothetical protein
MYRIGAKVVLAVAVGFFLVVLQACLKQTGGHFTYGLDDPYIHLAIAKNFAAHGIWGVSSYANTSASSSPLWTAMIAVAIKLTGNSIYSPLILGMIFAALCPAYLYKRFVARGMSIPVAGIASIAIFLVSPLHILPFIGMEHCLQIFLVLLYCFWLLDTLPRKSEAKDAWIAVALTALMCLTRYECIFLVVVPFFAAAFKRDFRLAGALAFGPILGLGGFALFSHLMGMPLVPNSILLKGNRPAGSLFDYLQNIFWRMRGSLYSDWPSFTDVFLLALTSGLILVTKPFRGSTKALQVVVWTSVIGCALHAGFATIGFSVYRYEAYLVAAMATSVALTWCEVKRYASSVEGKPLTQDKWLLGLLAVSAAELALKPVFIFLKDWVVALGLIAWLMVAGLYVMSKGELSVGKLLRVVVVAYIPIAIALAIQDRIEIPFISIPKASRDIYTQQYQMARFVNRFYPTGKVVANDIGAISYFNDVHLLDLYGLASNEVAAYRVAGNYDTKAIGKLLTKFDPDMMVIYPTWYRGKTAPPSFAIPVATWTLPSITASSSPTVMFYATTRAKAMILFNNLIAFQHSLPPTVKALYRRP